jgi:hypothetical protein
MKLGTYIMASEPISMTYFINPSHQSMCLYVYSPIVARQWLGKLLKRQRTHTWKNNFWRCWFLYGPCHIKRQLTIISSQNYSRVEAESNTATVTLTVVGGDEKRSLESETVRYGHESHGTRTRKWLGWRGPAAVLNDRPVLSSERASHINKPATVWQ